MQEDETKGWSAQRLYSEAKDNLNQRNYATAVTYYQKLEARYPYGRYAQQAQLDLGSLEAAAGRKLTEAERTEIAKVQHRAYRYTFIGSGLVTKNFLATCDQLAPGSSEKMKEMAKALAA